MPAAVAAGRDVRRSPGQLAHALRSLSSAQDRSIRSRRITTGRARPGKWRVGEVLAIGAVHLGLLEVVSGVVERATGSMPAGWRSGLVRCADELVLSPIRSGCDLTVGEWAIRPMPGALHRAARPLPSSSRRAHAGPNVPPSRREPGSTRGDRNEDQVYESADHARRRSRQLLPAKRGSPATWNRKLSATHRRRPGRSGRHSAVGIAACGGSGAQSASAIVSSDGYSVLPASVAGTLPPSVQSIVSSFAAGQKGSEEEVVLVFKSSVQNSEISTISQALLNTSPGVSATTNGNVLRVRGTASALSGV